jgi:colanic acid/amylovoran/stewartan biosynthesis glycosyltransferase WcaL/AmsK/CpsK
MKVAFLLNAFPKTSETFVVNQITGLIERRHEVSIFAQHRDSNEPLHGDVEKYQLIERTQYLHVPSDKAKRVFLALKTVLKWIWKRPAPLLETLNVFKFGKQALNLELLSQGRLFLENSSFDIIHCHFGPAGIFGQQLRSLGALEGPMITTVHGYDVTTFGGEERAKLYRDLFAQGEAFTCSSTFMRNKLVELGCPPQKTTCFKLGTDVNRFSFHERSFDGHGFIRIITVARLVEKKGIEYSIRAVANLVREFPMVRYNIVGDGHLRGRLQELIDKLGVASFVQLIGWKTQEEIQALYSESHLFVLCSVTSRSGDTEGQGMVLQEAQAMGLPVVCTSHNGFPDSILDGRSGFLVPEKDVDALTAKLADLIRDPQSWASLGRAGRKYVEAEYDLDKRNDALVELYRRVIAGQIPERL